MTGVQTCALPIYFNIEVLEESTSRLHIANLEEPTILKYNSRANGYNVAKGGYGGDLGPEANTKRTETIKNWSPEQREAYAKKIRNRNLGKTKDNDAGRKSQSEKITGNQFRLGKPHSIAGRAKISEANKGKIRSEKARQNYSESAKINKNGTRFAERRASCLCCCKEWDIGNFTQHIKRNIK